MIWALVLAGVMVLIGILVVTRLDLGKMAWGYLRRNPRQTAMAVAGLMVATATIVGSAVVTDSAATSLQNELERLRGSTDLVVEFRRPVEDTAFTADLYNVSSVEAIAWASAVDIPLFAEGGLIVPDGAVYGIGEDYADAVAWEVLEGDGDDLSLVLTEAMATRIGAEVGSTVRLVFPEPFVNPPQYQYFGHGDNARGTVTAVVTGPDGDPVTGPDDFVNFTLDVPDNIYDLEMEVRIVDSAATGWTVTWQDPTGEVRTNATEPDEGLGMATLYADQRWNASEAFIPGGPYEVSFQSDGAANADIQVSWYIQGVDGTAPWAFSAPGPVVRTVNVSAIVADGADPFGDGEAAFITHESLVDAAPDRKGVSLVAARIAPTASVPATANKIISLSESPDAESRDLRTGPEEAAKELRQQMVQMWIFMGGFTVIGAIVLMFVLVALLTEERRATLATVRAIGGQRGALVRVQLFEVFGLALLAGLAGGLVGLMVAQVLSGSVDAVWGLDRLVISPAVVIEGIAIGVLLILFFSLFAAWRSSRVEIAPALRDMDAPARGTRIRDILVAIPITLIGVYLAVLAGRTDPVATTMGVPMIALGGGIFASRWLPKWFVYPVVGGVFLVWTALTFAVLAQVESAGEALMLPVRALLFSVGGALLFAYLRPLHLVVRSMFGWLPGSLHLEQAVAQWRKRPSRIAMTIIMLSMMLMSVLFMTSLIAQEQSDYSIDAGGFDVVAWNQEPIDDVDEWLAEHPPLVDVDPFEDVADHIMVPWSPRTVDNEWKGTFMSIRNAYAVTDELAQAQDYVSVAGRPADDAFQAVLDDPRLMIVDQDMWNGPAFPEVGDQVIFRHPNTGNETKLTITAITDGGRMGAAYMHPDAFETVTTNDRDRSYAGTAFLMHTEEGADKGQVAARMETAFLEGQMRTQVIEPGVSSVNAIQSILSVFVVLSLAIGAVALGLIAARNVVQRRREIGMIRALGGTRRQIVTSITFETLLLVLISIAIGWIGAAMLLAGLTEDSPFTIDAGQAVWLSLYTLALGALAAVIPAYGAARLDPAVAVRNVE